MKCPACPAKAAVCSGSWGAMEATAISSSLKLLITFPANKKALITTRKKRDTIQFSDQFPNSKSSTGHYPSPTGITINGRRLKTRFKISAINDYGISAAADIAQVEVTWQIIVGAIAGVTPFVVAGIEFSKRILARTSTNLMGLEVNDHVSLQWPSYEQPQGSNLRPQSEQTSWSQALTTGPPSRWLTRTIFVAQDVEGFYRGRHGKDSSLVSVCISVFICIFLFIYTRRGVLLHM
ncbi:uncharacterized protein LOC18103253 isoform X3 [Populus trichocarpa]|uniref:uncharacterized protein LOC18103253 isoform X3 n=1 Tax=Populus trichocarpa TaxID=3694 RepID=UPI0022794E49|nr:uncharacterized protein LOC18103253 isoform X3 [Populus trichocarpa]